MTRHEFLVRVGDFMDAAREYAITAAVLGFVILVVVVVVAQITLIGVS